jgi:chemotaxis protein methyltransferase WspC
MPYARLEELLKRVTGLEAASIGSAAVEHAVLARAAACMLDVPSYLQRVHSSSAELQTLIDAVVVPETWFFRDTQAFTALARMALDDWLPAHGQGTMRLLSLPCSTGEEPYSMAMALLDAGFPAKRFSIDAVDISTATLARAERGVYGKNSFRGPEMRFRELRFDATEQGQRIRDELRQQVRFQHGNLLAPDFLPGSGIYDVIFCRNLLIYFDRATQDRAIEVLQRLLTPRGMLFVGPSETSLLLSHDFASTKLPLAFAFRRASPVAPSLVPAALARPIPRLPERPKAPLERVPVVAPQRTPSQEHGIEDAIGLADQGHLVEAAASCEAHLHKHGPSVQALHRKTESRSENR